MDHKLILLPVLLAVAGCTLSACSVQGPDAEPSVGMNQPSDLSVDFARDIAPELEIKCLECHNSKTKQRYSSFNMETRQSLLTSGQHAPVVVPGSGDSSYLVRVLRLGHAEFRGMPPSPDKILDDQIERIVTWIDEGAHWPEGFKLRRPDEW